MKKNKVGIIGAGGFVGKAMQKLFSGAVLYDINIPETSMENVNECEIAIVCVPTPATDGSKLPALTTVPE